MSGRAPTAAAPAVWIVGRGEPYWEEDFLAEELRRRGLDAVFAPIERLRFGTDGLSIHGVRESPCVPELVHIRSDAYTRLPADQVPLFYDNLELAEELGCTLVNDSRSLRRTRNKLRQAAVLRGAGVPVPQTCVVASIEELSAAMGELGTLIVKPPYGHASMDVLCVGVREAKPEPREQILVAHLLARHHALIAQRRIAGPLRELRIAVIGDRPAFCYELRRLPAPPEFPFALGEYERREAKLDAAAEELALRTCAALGLRLALIDLVHSPEGAFVIEANASISAWQGAHRDPRFDLTADGIGSAYCDLLNEAARR